MNGLDPAISIKYLIAGYTVIFSVCAIYLISIILRFRRLRKDLETLQELDNR